MCWIGKETDKRVSKEDTKVFKVLYTKPRGWCDLDRRFTRYFLSPYYRFYYVLNKLYESEVEVNKPLEIVPYSQYDGIVERRNIHKALHCYSSEMCTWDWIGYDLVTVKKKDRIFEQQLVNYPIVDNRNGEQCRVAAIVEGVIPAGTEYWLNDKGEIATSKLILREIKKIF